MAHFRNNLITDSSINLNVHELFINVNLIYANKLERSINNLQRARLLKIVGNRKYYNYIIMDAVALYKLLARFDIKGHSSTEITIQDTVEFKNSIIYIGKGCKDRKMCHLVDAKNVLEGNMQLSKINAKLIKI